MRTALFSLMGAGVLLLGACDNHESAPLRATAATTPTTVAASAAPSPAFIQPMPPSEGPPPAADHEEPTDVSTLRLPQSEDAEPEPVK